LRSEGTTLRRDRCHAERRAHRTRRGTPWRLESIARVLKYLPHSEYAPWVNDFIEECVHFPNGEHDDQVDAMAQTLLH
jgi:predicted phage terminase large subunit-like protein